VLQPLGDFGLGAQLLDTATGTLQGPLKNFWLRPCTVMWAAIFLLPLQLHYTR